MTSSARAGFLARMVIGVAVIAGSVGGVRADAINFQDLAPQRVASLDVGGVTITGSNTLVINSVPDVVPLGITIQGGVPGFGSADATIDPTESVTFHFDSGPVGNIVLKGDFLGTLGNTPLAAEGESIITAFGQTGQSLGAVALLPSSDLSFSISTAFSDQPISSFTFQPEGNAVNGNFATIAGLSYSAIPEPSSVIAWGAGVLIALGHGLRRRRRRQGVLPAGRRPISLARTTLCGRDALASPCS
jgi:hypothetical protein